MTNDRRVRQKRISNKHREVAEVLCQWINDNRLEQKPIGYLDLAELVGLNRFNIGSYLGDLSRECHYLGFPLITSIVNYAGTDDIAEQFYLMAFLAGRQDLNESNIAHEKERVFTQNWLPFRTHLESHTYFLQLPPIRI